MNKIKTHFWRIGQISFPLILATASGTILVLIDSFFATRISIEVYEAVFLALPILSLSTGIGVGLAAAIADLISKEKELVNIKRLLAASGILALISILLFLYFALFQPELIERVTGLELLPDHSPIVNEFRNYWKVILWTFPLQILFALTIQFLTILEKQKTGTAIIAVILILNVVLDYLFTQIIPLGVQGLAYSTMGVFLSGVILSIIPLRKETYFQVPYPSILNRLFGAALFRLTIITFMIFISIAIYSIAALFLNQIALSISSKALVVFAIYAQIMRIFAISTRGLAGGFIIYFGNALRDKATTEYFPIYWAATGWIAVINLLGSLLMFFIPVTLIQFFDNVDTQLYPDIIYFLGLGALVMIIYIVPRMALVGFISINKPVLLVLSSLVYVIIQITAAYAWVETQGVRGLIHAELAAAILTNLIFVPLFYYYLKQTQKRDESLLQ